MATKEIKFSGRYDEVKASVEPLLFCGPDGGPLTVDDIKIGSDKDDNPQIEIVVSVSSVKEAMGGSDAASEPIETRTLSTLINLKGNQEITLRVLSDAFGLEGDERLKDDGEDWLRLAAADHPKSLVPKIVQKPSKSLFLKAKVQADDKGDVKAIFFNPSSPPLRKSAATNKLADLKKKYGIGQ